MEKGTEEWVYCYPPMLNGTVLLFRYNPAGAGAADQVPATKATR